MNAAVAAATPALRVVRRAALLAVPAAALACAPARVGGAGTAPSPRAERAALRAVVDSMVEAPEFRNAHWGILIVEPATGDTLYSRNAGKLFMPASNMKILSGTTALALLGADFRFRTTFAARGPVRDSVLQGDLVVIGRGDPSVSDRMRGDAMRPLRQIADSLAARGIRRIAGRLLPGDDTFPDAAYGFGWSWDDFHEPYSAGVDELLFNEGFARITVRAGSRPGDPATVAVAPAPTYPPVRVEAVTGHGPDSAMPGGSSAPAASGVVTFRRDSTGGGLVIAGRVAPNDSVVAQLAFRDQRAAYLAALADALAERGITVGPAVATPAPGAAGSSAPRARVSAAASPVTARDSATAPASRLDTLFVIESPPLRDILRAFLKPSQNQIGEVLLKTLGLERTGVGTADSGRRVIERQLLAWGAEPDGFVVRDGSGLSRYNYLTPETLVRTLDAIRRDTAFAAFYDALPIAGVDGTIANRMRGTAAQGNARAKTGFVAQSRALSGYVTTADGATVIYSLLCNNWTVSVRNVERVQDAVVARLARMRLGTVRARAAAR